MSKNIKRSQKTQPKKQKNLTTNKILKKRTKISTKATKTQVHNSKIYKN